MLTLSGANTFTGSVAVNAGTLSIGSGTTSGALAANIANSSALVFNRSDASTYSGVISGAGSVEKKSAGTLTLSNTNTNTGGLTVSGGAVSFNTSAQLGASTNAITLNGGGLQWTSNFVSDISTTRTITIGSAGAKFDVGVYNVTLARNFGNGGSGGLTKAGLLNSIDSLIITGSPTYTGLTTVNAGFLIIGNNGTTGTLPGDAAVVGTGSLLIKRSNAYNYAGSISGAGVVSQEGAGTTSLTGAHTFTGNLQVVAGTLSIGNGGSTGSVATNGIVTSSGATLKWDTTTNTTYSGIISGAGALHKSSASTLTLTGANTLSGTSTVSTGTLQLGNGAATGSIAGPVSISTGATLSINHSDNVAFPYTISGAGTLTLSGTHARTGNTTVSAGTLSMSSAALGDAADVSIASGATLNLNFSGTDTVGQLSLGGVHQYTGTWGSLTSSATHKTASITGNGILNVTTSSMLFTEWATLNGLDGTAGKEAGLGDDPDKDGVANAFEFVLGGNPLTNNSSILPTAAVSGGYLTLSFSRTDESEYSVGVQILTSADLTTWTSVTVPVASGTEGGVIFTISENGTDADTITAQIPIGTNTRMFARLSAATY